MAAEQQQAMQDQQMQQQMMSDGLKSPAVAKLVDNFAQQGGPNGQNQGIPGIPGAEQQPSGLPDGGLG
jgi:hypothetical protein